MVREIGGFTDKEINLGNLRFHYLDWGNEGKQTILCLHGGSQTAHSWDEFSRVMQSDYHVVALDQRGHGDSDWSRRRIYTATAQTRDVHRFINALGLTNIILVGLSMGGRNSIVYSAMHPEKLSRLVIVDIGPEVMKKGGRAIQRFTSQDVQPTFDAFLDRAKKFNPRRPVEQLRERLGYALRQLPDGRWTWKYDRRRRSAANNGSYGPDLWPYVRRIKTPMLLIRGAESDVLAAGAARRFYEAVPGSSLVTIGSAGHTVNGDNPTAFNSVVRNWLSGSHKEDSEIG